MESKSFRILCVFLGLIGSQNIIGDTLVSVSPNATGYFNLKTIGRLPINDTIRFSAGLKIYCFPVPSLILEGTSVYYSIAIDTSSFLIAGFKNCTGLGTFTYMQNHATINNPDTVWNAVDRFPSDLRVLDTIKSSLDTSKGKGKLLAINAYSASGIGSRCANGSFSLNSNAIVYVKSKDGTSFKFQLVDATYEASSIFCSDTVHIMSIASLRIQWATDSAGNGIFPNTTSVISRRSNPTTFQKGVSVQKAVVLGNPGKQIEINYQNRQYSIKGRIMSSRLK